MINLRNHWTENQLEGFELIKNQDRPSKLQNDYQQKLLFDNSAEKLLVKNVDLSQKPKILKEREFKREGKFRFKKAQLLPYILGHKKTLSNQLSRSVLHVNQEQQVPADKSKPVKGNFFL